MDMDCAPSEEIQFSKPKRKNSEKRKEKSRYAARTRRSHESEQFADMAKNLPVPQSLVQNMDKASLMRLSISYIKQKQIVHHVVKDIKMVPSSPNTREPCLLQALDGFVLILSAEGEIVYISESVEIYLGLKQLDLIGSSIYDYSHPCDHSEIKDTLALKSDKLQSSSANPVDDEDGGFCNQCSFLIRMKCTLTEKGKCINLKAATYKVVYCSGYHTRVGKTLHMILTAEPIWNPNSTMDRPLTKYAFISHHSPDLKIVSIDDSIESISGFQPVDLIGKSIFNFCHALDAANLGSCFKTLFNKGQTKTGYYRFLSKHGGYFWLHSEATVVANNHTSQPQSVVCVNYVISGVENEDEIISDEQVQKPAVVQKERCDVDPIYQAVSPVPPAVAPYPNPNPYYYPTAVTSTLFSPVSPVSADIPVALPQPATASIFAPRTADMSSGFLMFTSDEDNPTTVLTDEDLIDPEQDLTHLAPLAGDTCDIPLDIGNLPPLDGLMDDLLKEMGLTQGNSVPVDSGPSNKTSMPLSETEAETSDFGCFSPDDSKLISYIPPVVAEEEIQFSCDDDSRETELRSGPEGINCAALVGGSMHKVNSANYALDEGGTNAARCNESASDSCASVSERVEGNTGGDHSPLTNDPFLSFTNGGFLSDFNSHTPVLDSSTSCDLSTHSNPNSGTSNTSRFIDTSSVWDSPPPSSNNSTLTNDLDICTSLEDDGETRTSLPLGDDFALLNDDSMWDSFINSNIGDVINTDDFLPTRNCTTDSSSVCSSFPKGPPPLSQSSNLAMLLQESSPTDSSSYKDVGKSATNGIVRQEPGVVIVHLKDRGKLNSSDVQKKVQDLLRSQGKQIPTKVISNPFDGNGKEIRSVLYADLMYKMEEDKSKTANLIGTQKRQCPMSPLSAKKQSCGTNGVLIANATVNSKRLKTDLHSPGPGPSQTKSPMSISASSVLMNLLVNGEDVSNGYTKALSSGRCSSLPLGSRTLAVANNQSLP